MQWVRGWRRPNSPHARFLKDNNWVDNGWVEKIGVEFCVRRRFWREWLLWQWSVMERRVERQPALPLTDWVYSVCPVERLVRLIQSGSNSLFSVHHDLKCVYLEAIYRSRLLNQFNKSDRAFSLFSCSKCTYFVRCCSNKIQLQNRLHRSYSNKSLPDSIDTNQDWEGYFKMYSITITSNLWTTSSEN